MYNFLNLQFSCFIVILLSFAIWIFTINTFGSFSSPTHEHLFYGVINGLTGLNMKTKKVSHGVFSPRVNFYNSTMRKKNHLEKLAGGGKGKGAVLLLIFIHLCHIWFSSQVRNVVSWCLVGVKHETDALQGPVWHVFGGWQVSLEH